MACCFETDSWRLFLRLGAGLNRVPPGDANCGCWQQAERPRVQSGILGSYLHSAALCFSKRSQRRTDESPGLILLPRLQVSRSKTRGRGGHTERSEWELWQVRKWIIKNIGAMGRLTRSFSADWTSADAWPLTPQQLVFCQLNDVANKQKNVLLFCYEYCSTLWHNTSEEGKKTHYNMVWWIAVKTG